MKLCEPPFPDNLFNPSGYIVSEYQMEVWQPFPSVALSVMTESLHIQLFLLHIEVTHTFLQIAYNKPCIYSNKNRFYIYY